MEVSQRGLDLIKRFEGLMLEAYQDVVGVWTIGYGHTSEAGPPKVTPGMEITEKEAEEILQDDLVNYEEAVEKAVSIAGAMARIVEIMQPMFEDWGEGHAWPDVLIEAMRIHAAACERDPAAAAALPTWLEQRATQRSWPLEREWIQNAYGEAGQGLGR